MTIKSFESDLISNVDHLLRGEDDIDRTYFIEHTLALVRQLVDTKVGEERRRLEEEYRRKGRKLK